MAFYGNSIASFPLRLLEVLVCRLSLCNRSHNVDTIRGIAGIVRTPVTRSIHPIERSIDRSVVVTVLSHVSLYHVDQNVLS